MFISPKLKVIGEIKKERFYCTICEYPLVTSADFEKDDKYHCCNDCYLKFVESRKIEWKNGWRPKKADVNSYISIKRKLYKHLSKEK